MSQQVSLSLLQLLREESFDLDKTAELGRNVGFFRVVLEALNEPRCWPWQRSSGELAGEPGGESLFPVVDMTRPI